MHKLFIVDDNMLERNGISNMLPWEKFDIELVGAFTNGKLALEAIEKLNPDIVLTDISMPIMDGIELATKIREKNITTKIIFMSCYSDFEYARKAIDLEVDYYLAKPFFADELKDVILRVLNKRNFEIDLKVKNEALFKEIEKTHPLLCDQFFTQLVYGGFNNEKEIFSRLEFLKVNIVRDNAFCLASLIIDIADNKYDENYYLNDYNIKKIINNENNENIFIYPIQEKLDEYILVFAVNRDGNEYENIFSSLVNIQKNISGTSIYKSKIIISNLCVNALEIKHLYRQLIYVAKAKYFIDFDEIIFYKDVEGVLDGLFEECFNQGGLYNEVRSLILNLSEENITEFTEKYFYKEKFVYSDAYLKSWLYFLVATIQIVLYELDSSLEKMVGDNLIIWKKLSNFETILDVKQWLYNLFLMIKQQMCIDRNTEQVELVEKIKEFLNLKYMEPFTIKDIAKQFFISESYINKIFKSIEGKTILNYLIQVRIEIAKKMLRVEANKIYFVANSVGYNNISHFCYLFQKLVGISPTEYRNKLLNN